MNPEMTPNNFATATLLPGSSWSDPYSLLTLTTESADAGGLVLKVNYDTACATLTPSFAGLFPTAGSSGSIAVTAPSTCAWTASSVTPWITLSGATSGSGNGSVPFTVKENEDLLQRTGFITIERQSLPLSQSGNAISADVSPIPGSGLNQTFTIDLTSLDTEAFDALQSFELQFAPFTGPNLLGGSSFCHVVASVGSDRNSLLLQLQDDSTGQFFPVTPLPLPGPAASASTSHCSLSTAGASVAFNPGGTAATLQLPLTFSSQYPGSYTVSLTTTFTGQGQSASLSSVPFGAWTVPGTPAVTSVSPSSIRVGYVGPISFGGAFTHFSNASTIVSNFLSLSAPSAPSIVALNGTLHAASNAPVGSQAFSIETGNEIVNASINLVTGVPSSINLETSSSPIFEGGSTSVTVSVSGYGPIPTGIVTLYNGQTILGTSPLSNADAVFALDSLGVGTLSLTATYSGDNVFLPSTTEANMLSVVGFTISASPSSLSVVAGNSATSVITITPGAGGFPSAIQLACSGAPSGTTCSLSPSTITPDAAAATATLTLTTTAIASSRPHTDATTALFALLLGGLPWIGLTARLRRHPFSLLSITLIAGLVVCSGCGDGGYTRHLAQPATLTITGTASGATTLVQTSDIAVAIN
ncbi:MAG TPA: Ig-like domain repeat protein [Edaphobacter sp.]|nr:Ig-like domain repeat protein [Edaphobacter sp.]